jgi:hypothetical protein
VMCMSLSRSSDSMSTSCSREGTGTRRDAVGPLLPAAWTRPSSAARLSHPVSWQALPHLASPGAKHGAPVPAGAEGTGCVQGDAGDPSLPALGPCPRAASGAAWLWRRAAEATGGRLRLRRRERAPGGMRAPRSVVHGPPAEAIARVGCQLGGVAVTTRQRRELPKRGAGAQRRRKRSERPASGLRQSEDQYDTTGAAAGVAGCTAWVVECEGVLRRRSCAGCDQAV